MTQAQSAALKFTQTRIAVDVDEKFTIEARFTNPDMLDYSWFSLRGIGPDLSEHTWGTKIVDLHTYTLYTESWTISLSDPGYYTLYVDCGGNSVDTLTASMTVYVRTPQTPSTLPAFLLFLVAVVVICAIAVAIRRRSKKVDYSQVEVITP